MKTKIDTQRPNSLSIFLRLIPSYIGDLQQLAIFHDKVSDSVKIDIDWEIQNMKGLADFF